MGGFLKIKDLGVVYTPEFITSYICEKSIFPYIIKKINGKLKSDYANFEDFFKSSNDDDLLIAFKILKNVKILDPSAGNGQFLVKTCMLFMSLYKIFREKATILKHKVF